MKFHTCPRFPFRRPNLFPVSISNLFNFSFSHCSYRGPSDEEILADLLDGPRYARRELPPRPSIARILGPVVVNTSLDVVTISTFSSSQPEPKVG